MHLEVSKRKTLTLPALSKGIQIFMFAVHQPRHHKLFTILSALQTDFYVCVMFQTEILNTLDITHQSNRK